MCCITCRLGRSSTAGTLHKLQIVPLFSSPLELQCMQHSTYSNCALAHGLCSMGMFSNVITNLLRRLRMKLTVSLFWNSSEWNAASISGCTEISLAVVTIGWQIFLFRWQKSLRRIEDYSIFHANLEKETTLMKSKRVQAAKFVQLIQFISRGGHCLQIVYQEAHSAEKPHTGYNSYQIGNVSECKSDETVTFCVPVSCNSSVVENVRAYQVPFRNVARNYEWLRTLWWLINGIWSLTTPAPVLLLDHRALTKKLLLSKKPLLRKFWIFSIFYMQSWTKSIRFSC